MAKEKAEIREQERKKAEEKRIKDEAAAKERQVKKTETFSNYFTYSGKNIS